jgi:predicted secreted hydrolase
MAKMSAAEALLAQLDSIPDYLRPKEPGVFKLMRDTAAKISPTGGSHAAGLAATIYQMSGIASGYGDVHPPTSISFPADHHLHLDCGNEWYWISCNLTAQGPDGPVKIGLLIDMLRIRVVSKAVQKQAEWSDEDCQVVWNAVTAVVADHKGGVITRRTPNVQWPRVGGKVGFPDTDFVYRCGPDLMIGPPEVLPLHVTVDDGSNLAIDIELSTDMPAKSAFFLQGKDGITPDPTAGIYYSWPQLKVAGAVTVEGQSYGVTGVGWIDHQLLARANPPPPPPPVAQPQLDGWNWCQFNFDNGEAFTAAAFQTGAIGTNKLIPYGFYLRRNGDVWDPEWVVGGLAIDNLIPTLRGVLQPTSWTYAALTVQSPATPSPTEVLITPAPWVADGSFETPDLAVPSEVPVTVAAIRRTTAPDGAPVVVALGGAGYCEAVGFEPRDVYMRRAVAFLEGGAP